MKRYIYSKEEILAMSELRATVAAKLESKTKEIVKHLMKLRLYHDTKYVDHWRKEVASFLYEVSRLKPSNKYPDRDFILDNTYRMNLPDFDTWLSNVIYDNDELTPADYDYRNLVKDIGTYFDWIASELSKHGEIYKKTIVEKLEELNF